MAAKVCALIEFERTEFALKAVSDLNNQDDEDKMKVKRSFLVAFELVRLFHVKRTNIHFIKRPDLAFLCVTLV